MAWELLSDISDDRNEVQALCKSVICHTRPGQLLRSKTKLFYLLVKEKKFDVANLFTKISLKQSKSLVRIDLMIGVLYLVNLGLNQLRKVDYLSYCYNRSNDISLMFLKTGSRIMGLFMV